MAGDWFQENSLDLIEDIDNLKQFTIPKRKKQSSTDILIPLTTTSTEYKNEILEVIFQCFKYKDSINNFTFSSPFLVQNPVLLSEFDEKKKSMKDVCSEKELKCTYAFLQLNSKSQATAICHEGLKNKNHNFQILGNPSLGVYVNKYSDVLPPSFSSKHLNGVLVIFKHIKGKVKAMVENTTGEALDPTPGFDCHVLKSSTHSNIDVFKASQIYVYEYDSNLDALPRPRNLLPYAMVNFTVRSSYFTFVHKVYHVNHSPRVSGLEGRPSPRETFETAGCNDSMKPPLDRSSRHHRLSKAEDTMSPAINGQHANRLDPFKIPSSPVFPGHPQSVPGSPQQFQSCHGQEVNILWSGSLFHNDVFLCQIALTSDYLKCFRYLPFQMDRLLVEKEFMIKKSFSHFCLNKLTKLNEDSCTQWRGIFFNHFKVLPLRSSFKELYQHLSINSHSYLCSLEESVKLLLLPPCEETKKLGLTSENVLHAIVISNRSDEINSDNDDSKLSLDCLLDIIKASSKEFINVNDPRQAKKLNLLQAKIRDLNASNVNTSQQPASFDTSNDFYNFHIMPPRHPSTNHLRSPQFSGSVSQPPLFKLSSASSTTSVTLSPSLLPTPTFAPSSSQKSSFSRSFSLPSSSLSPELTAETNPHSPLNILPNSDLALNDIPASYSVQTSTQMPVTLNPTSSIAGLPSIICDPIKSAPSSSVAATTRDEAFQEKIDDELKKLFNNLSENIELNIQNCLKFDFENEDIACKVGHNATSKQDETFNKEGFIVEVNTTDQGGNEMSDNLSHNGLGNKLANVNNSAKDSLEENTQSISLPSNGEEEEEEEEEEEDDDDYENNDFDQEIVKGHFISSLNRSESKMNEKADENITISVVEESFSKDGSSSDSNNATNFEEDEEEDVMDDVLADEIVHKGISTSTSLSVFLMNNNNHNEEVPVGQADAGPAPEFDNNVCKQDEDVLEERDHENVNENFADDEKSYEQFEGDADVSCGAEAPAEKDDDDNDDDINSFDEDEDFDNVEQVAAVDQLKVDEAEFVKYREQPDIIPLDRSLSPSLEFWDNDYPSVIFEHGHGDEHQVTFQNLTIRKTVTEATGGEVLDGGTTFSCVDADWTSMINEAILSSIEEKDENSTTSKLSEESSPSGEPGSSCNVNNIDMSVLIDVLHRPIHSSNDNQLKKFVTTLKPGDLTDDFFNMDDISETESIASYDHVDECEEKDENVSTNADYSNADISRSFSDLTQSDVENDISPVGKNQTRSSDSESPCVLSSEKHAETFENDRKRKFECEAEDVLSLELNRFYESVNDCERQLKNSKTEECHSVAKKFRKNGFVDNALNVNNSDEDEDCPSETLSEKIHNSSDRLLYRPVYVYNKSPEDHYTMFNGLMNANTDKGSNSGSEGIATSTGKERSVNYNDEWLSKRVDNSSNTKKNIFEINGKPVQCVSIAGFKWFTLSSAAKGSSFKEKMMKVKEEPKDDDQDEQSFLFCFNRPFGSKDIPFLEDDDDKSMSFSCPTTKTKSLKLCTTLPKEICFLKWPQNLLAIDTKFNTVHLCSSSDDHLEVLTIVNCTYLDPRLLSGLPVGSIYYPLIHDSPKNTQEEIEMDSSPLDETCSLHVILLNKGPLKNFINTKATFKSKVNNKIVLGHKNSNDKIFYHNGFSPTSGESKNPVKNYEFKVSSDNCSEICENLNRNVQTISMMDQLTKMKIKSQLKIELDLIQKKIERVKKKQFNKKATRSKMKQQKVCFDSSKNKYVDEKQSDKSNAKLCESNSNVINESEIDISIFINPNSHFEKSNTTSLKSLNFLSKASLVSDLKENDKISEITCENVNKNKQHLEDIFDHPIFMCKTNFDDQCSSPASVEVEKRDDNETLVTSQLIGDSNDCTSNDAEILNSMNHSKRKIIQLESEDEHVEKKFKKEHSPCNLVDIKSNFQSISGPHKFACLSQRMSRMRKLNAKIVNNVKQLCCSDCGKYFMKKYMRRHSSIAEHIKEKDVGSLTNVIFSLLLYKKILKIKSNTKFFNDHFIHFYQKTFHSLESLKSLLAKLKFYQSLFNRNISLQNSHPFCYSLFSNTRKLPTNGLSGFLNDDVRIKFNLSKTTLNRMDNISYKCFKEFAFNIETFYENIFNGLLKHKKPLIVKNISSTNYSKLKETPVEHLKSLSRFVHLHDNKNHFLKLNPIRFCDEVFKKLQKLSNKRTFPIENSDSNNGSCNKQNTGQLSSLVEIANFNCPTDSNSDSNKNKKVEYASMMDIEKPAESIQMSLTNKKVDDFDPLLHIHTTSTFAIIMPGQSSLKPFTSSSKLHITTEDPIFTIPNSCKESTTLQASNSLASFNNFNLESSSNPNDEIKIINESVQTPTSSSTAISKSIISGPSNVTPKYIRQTSQLSNSRSQKSIKLTATGGKLVQSNRIMQNHYFNNSLVSVKSLSSYKYPFKSLSLSEISCPTIPVGCSAHSSFLEDSGTSATHESQSPKHDSNNSISLNNYSKMFSQATHDSTNIVDNQTHTHTDDDECSRSKNNSADEHISITNSVTTNKNFQNRMNNDVESSVEDLDDIYSDFQEIEKDKFGWDEQENKILFGTNKTETNELYSFAHVQHTPIPQVSSSPYFPSVSHCYKHLVGPSLVSRYPSWNTMSNAPLALPPQLIPIQPILAALPINQSNFSHDSLPYQVQPSLYPIANTFYIAPNVVRHPSSFQSSIFIPSVPPPPLSTLQSFCSTPMGQLKCNIVEIKNDDAINCINKRIYVFNKERSITKNIENFLSFKGALCFDPFNVIMLRHNIDIQCFVLIFHEDVDKLDEIPNILQLKKDLRVQFVTYETVLDVKFQKFKWIFPKGGVVFIEEDTFLSFKIDAFEMLCESLVRQAKENNKPWRLMLNDNINDVLAKLKNESSDDSLLVDHFTQLQICLKKYESLNLLHYITGLDHKSMTEPQTIQDYLKCCLHLQRQYHDMFRHFLLVTECRMAAKDTMLFVSRGIDVLSIDEFTKGFLPSSIGQTHCTPLVISLKCVPAMYEDATMSTAVETFNLAT